MSKKIDFNNLIYHFIAPGLAPINFIGFKGPLKIYNKIRNAKTSVEKINEDQKKFKSSFSEITAENLKYRKDYQLITIKNIKNLYNLREKVIKLCNDCVKFRSEAMYKKKT